MARPEETKGDKPETVQAVVADRRSIVIQNDAGLHRRVGPGTVVNLPKAAVASLRASGFLMQGDAPVAPEPKQEERPDPRPTVNGRDGSTVGVPAER